MSATDVEAWLRERLTDVPTPLADEMRRALDAIPPNGDVSERLASAALHLYARLRAGGATRADALPLLAADALLTYALEACAEADPSAVAGAAERWGAGGSLGELASSGDVGGAS